VLRHWSWYTPEMIGRGAASATPWRVTSTMVRVRAESDVISSNRRPDWWCRPVNRPVKPSASLPSLRRALSVIAYQGLRGLAPRELGSARVLYPPALHPGWTGCRDMAEAPRTALRSGRRPFEPRG